MKIVIDIPEEIYVRIMSRTDYAYDVMQTIRAVECGKVLPKGHDDLIDRREVFETLGGELLGLYGRNALMEIKPTIEADKEGADE